jgi:hypothetical protein
MFFCFVLFFVFSFFLFFSVFFLFFNIYKAAEKSLQSTVSKNYKPFLVATELINEVESGLTALGASMYAFRAILERLHSLDTQKNNLVKQVDMVGVNKVPPPPANAKSLSSSSSFALPSSSSSTSSPKESVAATLLHKLSSPSLHNNNNNNNNNDDVDAINSLNDEESHSDLKSTSLSSLDMDIKIPKFVKVSPYAVEDEIRERHFAAAVRIVESVWITHILSLLYKLVYVCVVRIFAVILFFCFYTCATFSLSFSLALSHFFFCFSFVSLM